MFSSFFLFRINNNYYTPHIGIVPMLAMSEQLHSKHTGVFNHIWRATTPDVEFLD